MKLSASASANLNTAHQTSSGAKSNADVSVYQSAVFLDFILIRSLANVFALQRSVLLTSTGMLPHVHASANLWTVSKGSTGTLNCANVSVKNKFVQMDNYGSNLSVDASVITPKSAPPVSSGIS